ncbi:hypothetical protein [Acinetobacter pittii]|uniref:hypothetical protein n=1 Tax=Acinetobacter pittii TaxID=48296 RepID=UPI00192C6B24|nr:hypothetical protein [Acinetobacter pittii]
MDNYKILNSYTNKIIKLLNELGYAWVPTTNDSEASLLKSHWILAESSGDIAYSSTDSFCEQDSYKELSFGQLNDLVVLKRNDVKDANVEDGTGFPLYLSSTNELYVNDCEWKLSKKNGDLDYICKLKLIHRPQDPALISGANIPSLIKKGESVQFRSAFNVQGGGDWQDLNLERDEEEFSLGDLINTRFEWRLKPQTIKLDLEIPAPYKAKIGGRDDTSFVLNVGRHQYLYQNEDDYTKARDALEAVFDSALRGTNS